ncbi:uncharacterized protein LOC135926373 isoform X2 [Gordionus sp. m RMFG-2023]|uniref:uncharacterized protein LOC135926373 isoform X2 n=1 Tax=Gordionus sp. m RMFG-2023 TaxID=3053472 RepID=UPI0031FD359E
MRKKSLINCKDMSGGICDCSGFANHYTEACTYYPGIIPNYHPKIKIIPNYDDCSRKDCNKYPIYDDTPKVVFLEQPKFIEYDNCGDRCDNDSPTSIILIDEKEKDPCFGFDYNGSNLHSNILRKKRICKWRDPNCCYKKGKCLENVPRPNYSIIRQT